MSRAASLLVDYIRIKRLGQTHNHLEPYRLQYKPRCLPIKQKLLAAGQLGVAGQLCMGATLHSRGLNGLQQMSAFCISIGSPFFHVRYICELICAHSETSCILLEHFILLQIVTVGTLSKD